VLTELPCGRNRRKQARPVKAEVLPNQKFFAQCSPPMSMRTPSPAVPSERESPSAGNPSRGSTPKQLASVSPLSLAYQLPQPSTPLPSVSSACAAVTSSAAALSGKVAPSCDSVSSLSASPISNTLPLASPLPLSYPSFYPNSIQNNLILLHSQPSMQTPAAASAMLLAQTLLNSVSKAPPAMLPVNGSSIFRQSHQTPTSLSLPFNKSNSESKAEQSVSKSLLPAKKEPKVSPINYSTHSVSIHMT